MGLFGALYERKMGQVLFCIIILRERKLNHFPYRRLSFVGKDNCSAMKDLTVLVRRVVEKLDRV